MPSLVSSGPRGLLNVSSSFLDLSSTASIIHFSTPFPRTAFFRCSLEHNLKVLPARSLSVLGCFSDGAKSTNGDPISLLPLSDRKKVTFYRFSCAKKSQTGDVQRKKLAVFVSGGGSNFKSIHHACVQDLVNGDVVLVVTDKRGCGGAEYARNEGIPVIHYPRTKNELNGLSSSDLVAALRRYEVNYLLLAGYLKLLPLELIQAYPQAIVNIHPSLLPSFGGKGYYGMKVHKAVIASGARYSGATIHFVDEEYDTGRILAQRVVPVLANDTPEHLATRVLQEEHRLYVDVVAALCDDRICWRNDGVPLIQTSESSNVYV